MPSLRTALWRIHRRSGSSFVVTSATDLTLRSTVTVDFWDMTKLALTVSHGAMLEVQTAARLCRSGELLPTWPDQWVVSERERFRQLRLNALETLSKRFAEEGLYGLAVECAFAAVASAPLRESAHRPLIQAYLAQGNVDEALRNFRSYCQQLAKHAGAQPSSAFVELVRPWLR